MSFSKIAIVNYTGPVNAKYRIVGCYSNGDETTLSFADNDEQLKPIFERAKGRVSHHPRTGFDVVIPGYVLEDRR
jgi:hypothetical protein